MNIFERMIVVKLPVATGEFSCQSSTDDVFSHLRIGQLRAC